MGLVRPAEHEVTLSATAAQLGDDVAARDQRERMRKDLVVALERRLEVPLLELDVAQVLEAEELGAGFANRRVHAKPAPKMNCRLLNSTRMELDQSLQELCVAKVRLVPPTCQER